MSEIIWGIDMNNSSTNINLDKKFCKNYGELCELATDFGYCQLTACIKHSYCLNCGADMIGEEKMTWEDFLDNIKVDSTYPGQTLTNIECPKCGRHIYLDTTIVLTTNPCQYHYWCSCGWEGYTTERWIGEGSKYV